MKLSKNPKGLSLVSLNLVTIGQLYRTIIFTKEQDIVTLKAGGWYTAHTKKCINLICRDLGLDIYVSQVKGVWQVSIGDVTLPFVDGMQIKV